MSSHRRSASRGLWSRVSLVLHNRSWSRVSLAGIVLAGLLVLTLGSCSESPTEPEVIPFDPGDGVLPVTNNDPETFVASSFVYAAEAWVPASGAPILRDRKSGSLFNLHGQFFSGPLAEDKIQLPQLYTFNAFWFAWSIFYPGSEIWGRETTVRDARIEAEGGCLVPCDEIRRACGGGRDCIPSLPNTGAPRGALHFTRAGTAESSYLADGDLVIGLWDGEEARAYPRNILWWHEIANEIFGGQRLSVTLCPLTGSTLVFAAEDSHFGVSGNLYNSNLVMYDHSSKSLWPQMRRQAVTGERIGTVLAEGIPFTETTWGMWKQLHPATRVLSSDTGFSRDYRSYPYGAYRDRDDDTFSVTRPAPDPQIRGKAMTTGLIAGGIARAYVHEELGVLTGKDRGIVNDTIAGMPVVIVYDVREGLLMAVHGGVPDVELELEWATAP